MKIAELETALTESWSKKYKRSINCDHPKGFSQRAHCAGRRARRAGRKTKSHTVLETLDSAYKFKHRGKDGRDTDIYSFTPEGGSKINVSIFYEERTGIGHVIFYRDSDDSEGMTGEHPHDSTKVLGTVKAIVVHHLKKHPEIKSIRFEASNKDKSRVKAYDAIARRLGGKADTAGKRYASYEFPNAAVAEATVQPDPYESSSYSQQRLCV
jgi:hypothetical protein